MNGLLAQVTGFDRLETWFVRLIDEPELTALFVVGGLLAAALIGAAHALAPGHGKAIAAAYLVGAKGRPRDALALGVVVALMHSASVVVLGLGIHTLTRTPVLGDRAGPWMTLTAGGLVLVVGVGLIVRHARRQRALAGVGRPGHPPGRASALSGDHPGALPGDHAHHLPPGAHPLSRRGLVLIGMSGGLLPSPSAFLVLATAVFLGRTAFGLALVAAFSVGLAATLTALGLAVLRGRDAVTRRAASSPRLARVLGLVPLGSALAVTAAGGWLTFSALRLL